METIQLVHQVKSIIFNNTAQESMFQSSIFNSIDNVFHSLILKEITHDSNHNKNFTATPKHCICQVSLQSTWDKTLCIEGQKATPRQQDCVCLTISGCMPITYIVNQGIITKEYQKRSVTLVSSQVVVILAVSTLIKDCQKI